MFSQLVIITKTQVSLHLKSQVALFSADILIQVLLTSSTMALLYSSVPAIHDGVTAHTIQHNQNEQLNGCRPSLVFLLTPVLYCDMTKCHSEKGQLLQTKQ